MKIVYVSNFLNHHQTPLADAMNQIPNVQYTFVEMEAMPETFQRNGYSDFSDRPYILQAWRSDSMMRKAKQLIIDSDVVLFGGCYFDLMSMRLSCCSDKELTFHVGERWLKRGLLNLLSPRLIRFYWLYHTRYFKKSRFYSLNASAFAVCDNDKLGLFKSRSFKWGYFTKVDDDLVINSPDSFSQAREVQLMWCARFIAWKHPDLPVLLAKQLKGKGVPFVLDMYGSGELFEATRSLAKELHVEDVVIFRGNAPNEKILQEMRQHDMFIFTSDRNEGWGAVLNEAMSNGCVPVASDSIGSVPFLIKDGKNGLIFKSGDIESLTDKVCSIINDPYKRYKMAQAAYYTMRNEWSPEIAAHNFVLLCYALSGSGEIPSTGPGSISSPTCKALS